MSKEKNNEVVYFVAIRTTDARGGAEVQEAMRVLNEAGVLPPPGAAPESYHACAWATPYAEINGSDHLGYLLDLGLDFDNANRIITCVTCGDSDA